MIEVDALLFAVISSALILSIVILMLVLFFILKKIGRDKKAAIQLVSQIKKQSKLRLEETGSFLKESYQLEDNELSNAVKLIDQSEKKLIQKIINMYVKREYTQLTSMDAAVAELVAVYKQLKPAQVKAEIDKEITVELQNQLDEALQKNDRLSEELGITKQTMANMISEFGSMFGGGSEHELAKHEVVGRVQGSATEKTKEQTDETLNEELDLSDS